MVERRGEGRRQGRGAAASRRGKIGFVVADFNNGAREAGGGGRALNLLGLTQSDMKRL